MKKLSLFALAAAGLFIGACSEKDEVAQESFNKYDMIEGQSSWISVGIALSGDDNTTRANEDLNDGEAAEYAVNDAYLVLFKGSDEDNATLIKEYDITPEFEGETGDNVSGGGTAPNNHGEVSHTSKKIVKEIDNPSLGGEDNLYGYVILNAKNSTNLVFTAGEKFSAFKVRVLKAIGIADESKGYGAINTEKGLVMTSVPVATKAGGTNAPETGTEVTTLAKIDKNAVYTTKAAAEAGTATACIYVERAAVKVTVENKAEKIELETGELEFTFNGWALGNVNSSTTGYYNTRQFDLAWLPYINLKNSNENTKYRMVGRTQFFTGTHAVAFRTYFGRDVNYDADASGLLDAQIADAKYTLADKASTYTYENTFDEDHQTWKNTTYAGFKMTISGGDFYTIDGAPNTRVTEAQLPAEIAKQHSSIINTAISNIEAAINEDLGKTESTINEGKSGEDVITKVQFKVVPVVIVGTRDEDDGSVSYTFTLKLDEVKNNTKGAESTFVETTDAIITKLETLAGTNLSASHTGTTKVFKFVGGVVYYSARIAHFGDNETPWDAPAEAYDNYEKIYPTNGQTIDETPVVYGSNRANAWLGRWGIVRNNWYKLTIDEIKGLGSPVPEDYSGDAGKTPDDNPKPKYYIQAHIHILPWAVRNQSVKF